MLDVVVCCTGSIGCMHLGWNVVRRFGIRWASWQCFRRVFLWLMLELSWISVRWVVSFCDCAWKGFCGSVVQSLSQCHISSDATPEDTLDILVSLLRGRHVLLRGCRSYEYLLERFFAFDTKDFRTLLFACSARLVDKNGIISTWLQFTKRSCIPWRSITDVKTCCICVSSMHCSQSWQICPRENVVRRWLQYDYGIARTAQVVQLIRQCRELSSCHSRRLKVVIERWNW